MDEFEKFFDSITPAGSYDAHDPTHRALRYTQEIAWRAGREAGMREAASLAEEVGEGVISRHIALAARDAILAAIGEGK